MRTRSVSAAVAAVLVVTALAGCTASSSGGGSTAGGAAEFQSGTGRMASDSSASGGSAGKAGTAAADRSVVTTGSLRLVAEHPIRAAQRIADLVTAAGGSVSRSTEDPSGRASASLTLRIPSAAFDRTLTAIEQEGDVRDVSTDATDVTARVTDYSVRIANLRTSITRLQELLSKATTSVALVEIEGALTDRQTSLEQLLGEQRTLTDQVASATLQVRVITPAAAPKAGPDDFLAGVVSGFDALVASGAALAVAVGVLLPWAVVLGALGAAAWAVVRRVRRRSISA